MSLEDMRESYNSALSNYKGALVVAVISHLNISDFDDAMKVVDLFVKEDVPFFDFIESTLGRDFKDNIKSCGFEYAFNVLEWSL